MKKILIVDDDPDYQMLCQMILQSAGYQVAQAFDGTAAIAALREFKPDLILLDVMMSTVLEGVEVCRHIKGDPNLRAIPIVMISSITTSEYASAFPDDERIPIDAWLTKPIQPDVLIKIVQRFLGQPTNTEVAANVS